MIVEPYGELRFLVVSDNMDSKDKYLVDLAWYGGNGKCDCYSFNVTCKPKLEGPDAMKPGYLNDNFRCKHLKYIHSIIGAKLIYDAIKENKVKLTAGNLNF